MYKLFSTTGRRYLKEVFKTYESARKYARNLGTKRAKQFSVRPSRLSLSELGYEIRKIPA